MPSPLFIQAEPDVQYDEYEEEDDELGYYPDGVKRTLTDAQIAMFRHSEIQALIKEREAHASGDTGSSRGTRSEARPISARKDFQRHNKQQQNRVPRKPRQAKARKKAAEAALDEARRRRRNSSSDLEEPRKKQFLKEDQQDPDDFLSDGDEKTYRRKAREADEIKEALVELDY